MIDNTIESKINLFLQKNVSIFIEGHKPIKEGKLLIFKIKEFYFNFTIKTGNTTKVVELPYPFSIEQHEDHLKFSYNTKDFVAKNQDLELKILLLAPEKKTKLYNSTVVLSATK